MMSFGKIDVILVVIVISARNYSEKKKCVRYIIALIADIKINDLKKKILKARVLK